MIILLDEYDMLMQEAYVNGSLFNATFKTNPYLERTIINYLDTRKFRPYWANTSSNILVSKIIRESNKNIKQNFETLLDEGTITVTIDE